MKLIVKKENESLAIKGQEEKNEYSFSIEAIGIKSKDDIQEIIRQCRLVENQLPDGMDKTVAKTNSLIQRGVISIIL